MQVKVKLFANLLDKISPRPRIGEAVSIEVHDGATIKDLMNTLNLTTDDVSLVFINSVHRKFDYRLEPGMTVVFFSPTGGGIE